MKSSIVKGTVTSFQNSYIHYLFPNFLPRPPYRFNFLLIGMQAASLQSKAISAPEYPSVFCTTSSNYTVESSWTYFKLILSIYLRPIYVGKGIYILFQSLLLIAQSKSHGRFVAPITTIDFPSSPELTPSILVISSVFTFRLDSSSFQPLFEARESIQSIKIVAGAQNLAISNNSRTNFQESPFHLEAKLDEVTLKNVVFPPEAIALASNVFPVPGGPNRRTPFQALRIPLNKCGIRRGSRTASSKTSLAFQSSAISSNVTSGLKQTTSFYSISIRFESGPFPSGQQCFKNVFFYQPSEGLLLGFLAFFIQGFQYYLPFANPLLLATAGDYFAIFGTVFFERIGFFFGQISFYRSQNYFQRNSRYFQDSFLSILQRSFCSLYFLLQTSSSSCTNCFLTL